MTTLTEPIHVILNILSSPMPAYVLIFWLFSWVYDDFHTMMIQTIVFIKVKDIKFNFLVYFGVAHFEKEPLRVSSCVDIILKE